jgi:hypothetical protein
VQNRNQSIVASIHCRLVCHQNNPREDSALYQSSFAARAPNEGVCRLGPRHTGCAPSCSSERKRKQPSRRRESCPTIFASSEAKEGIGSCAQIEWHATPCWTSTGSTRSTSRHTSWWWSGRRKGLAAKRFRPGSAFHVRTNAMDSWCVGLLEVPQRQFSWRMDQSDDHREMMVCRMERAGQTRLPPLCFLQHESSSLIDRVLGTYGRGEVFRCVCVQCLHPSREHYGMMAWESGASFMSSLRSVGVGRSTVL